MAAPPGRRARGGEPGAVDGAVLTGPRETRLDRATARRTGIEPVHGRVGVEAPARRRSANIRGRGRLAHADRAGEAEDEHHARSTMSATIDGAQLGVTAGRTPNQRSKPGTA